MTIATPESSYLTNRIQGRIENDSNDGLLVRFNVWMGSYMPPQNDLDFPLFNPTPEQLIEAAKHFTELAVELSKQMKEREVKKSMTITTVVSPSTHLEKLELLLEEAKKKPETKNWFLERYQLHVYWNHGMESQYYQSKDKELWLALDNKMQTAHEKGNSVKVKQLLEEARKLNRTENGWK